MLGGSRPLVGITRNRSDSHMLVVSAYLKISEMLLLCSLTTKTTKGEILEFVILSVRTPIQAPELVRVRPRSAPEPPTT